MTFLFNPFAEGRGRFYMVTVVAGSPTRVAPESSHVAATISKKSATPKSIRMHLLLRISRVTLGTALVHEWSRVVRPSCCDQTRYFILLLGSAKEDFGAAIGSAPRNRSSTTSLERSAAEINKSDSPMLAPVGRPCCAIDKRASNWVGEFCKRAPGPGNARLTPTVARNSVRRL